MQACEQHRLSPEEYLAAERVSSVRHEYFDGEVFASDMKVKIKSAEKYTHPDVVVVCRKEEYADDKKDVLLNPVIIVEILSDGTEAYDRGDKFSHYQLIPSLAEYILVCQYACKIERLTRQADSTWVYAAFHRMEDVLALASIQCELPLAEVYSSGRIA
ncbi:MAG: putative restriction endonuclease [Candidatus Electronema aureum]|uniref:Restriction endonuclease n=1 Tax=Candidatus Electronema aureum TaxID=2005002 RepID=A0A521FZR0_9BACT|nr:MAG: putative restriction endonuclease [Candidatus Electronema aureum]